MKDLDVGDAYVILGILLLSLDKVNKAELYFKQALKMREAIGDKKRIAACYLNIAVCHQRKFNIKTSEEFYKKALDIYQEIGYQDGIIVALLDLGALYVDYNLSTTEEYYLKAFVASKLINSRRNLVLLYNNLGEIYRFRLMDDQAHNYYKQALKLAKEINYGEGLIFTNLSLSELFREKDQLKAGKNHLQAAQRVARKFDLKFYSLMCVMEEHNYLLLSRNLKKLITLSEKLIAQAKLEHNINYRIYGLIYRARVMVKLKQFAKAHAYYNKAYNLVKTLPDNRITGEIYYLKGIAYRKERKLKEALKMFLQANRIFEAVGNLRYLAKIEEEIANTHIK
jgi:tetratricopeptide (TPR) repeat protein